MGATTGHPPRETATCRWLPRRVASVERHEKLRKDTQQACVPSGCWDITYNREDSQDISLPERLKGTGNRRTKSAEEPIKSEKLHGEYRNLRTILFSFIISKQRRPDCDAVNALGPAVQRGDFLLDDRACDGFASRVFSPQPGNASRFRHRLRCHCDYAVLPRLFQTDMDCDGSGHRGPSGLGFVPLIPSYTGDACGVA
jgi:hypothetical protein